MLHQYTQNDINREPKLLKKWVTENTNTDKGIEKKEVKITKVSKNYSRHSK